MQMKNISANQSRTNKTRAALVDAMRHLILEQGYAHAGTPQIVERAGVTRGALYHHFDDKKQLFRTLIEDELKVVARAITGRGTSTNEPMQALKRGADAFIITMAQTGRTQLILVEAPSVLGRTELLKIEDKYTRLTLKQGLLAAMENGNIENLPLPPLLEVLSAMFDSAALSIDAGMPKQQVLDVVHRVIDGLAGPEKSGK